MRQVYKVQLSPHFLSSFFFLFFSVKAFYQMAGKETNTSSTSQQHQTPTSLYNLWNKECDKTASRHTSLCVYVYICPKQLCAKQTSWRVKVLWVGLWLSDRNSTANLKSSCPPAVLCQRIKPACYPGTVPIFSLFSGLLGGQTVICLIKEGSWGQDL